MANQSQSQVYSLRSDEHPSEVECSWVAFHCFCVETPPPVYSPTIDSQVSSPPDGTVLEAMQQPRAVTPTGEGLWHCVDY